MGSVGLKQPHTASSQTNLFSAASFWHEWCIKLPKIHFSSSCLCWKVFLVLKDLVTLFWHYYNTIIILLCWCLSTSRHVIDTVKNVLKGINYWVSVCAISHYLSPKWSLVLATVHRLGQWELTHLSSILMMLSSLIKVFLSSIWCLFTTNSSALAVLF